MDSLPLGERIRAARLERKMTQDELARDTFSKSYVSAVELGKIHPSIKALRILARRLQLPASYFLETLEPDIETQQAQLAMARVRLLVALGGREQEALDILNAIDQERLTEHEAAEVVFLQGRALTTLDRTTEALTKLAQAQIDWEELENPTWVERTRNLIGEIYYRQHKYVAAQELHKLNLDAIEQGLVRDPNLKLAVFANMARVYTALDMHDAARNLFVQAGPVAEDTATPQALVNTLWRVAETYENERNLGEALQSIEQGISALELAETSRLVTNLHLTFGASYLSGHNWEEAENCFQKALQSATPQLPGAARIAAYDNLANLFLRQERLDEALQAADLANRILEEEGDLATLSNSFSTDSNYASPHLAAGRVLLTLARIQEKRNDHAQSDEYFNRSIDSFKQGHQPEQLSAAYFAYGEVLLERGDSARGANYLKMAYEEKSRMV